MRDPITTERVPPMNSTPSSAETPAMLTAEEASIVLGIKTREAVHMRRNPTEQLTNADIYLIDMPISKVGPSNLLSTQKAFKSCIVRMRKLMSLILRLSRYARG